MAPVALVQRGRTEMFGRHRIRGIQGHLQLGRHDLGIFFVGANAGHALLPERIAPPHETASDVDTAAGIVTGRFFPTGHHGFGLRSGGEATLQADTVAGNGAV